MAKPVLHGRRGKGLAKLLAIIDTGIDYDHPDFRNRGGTTSNITGGGQLARSLDRTILDGSFTTDAWDGYGHGTVITGIAASATNNIEGVTGVGYNANVMMLRVTDDFGNGPKVISQRLLCMQPTAGLLFAIYRLRLGIHIEQDAELRLGEGHARGGGCRQCESTLRTIRAR